MTEHDKSAMRREALFNRDGFYSFVVQSNALLHGEAVKTGIEAVRAAFCSGPSRSGLSVLDLACGGEPLAIADILAAFPQCRFDYHGVDINPDQVRGARQFPFPANVVNVRIDEGSAWDLQHLPLQRSYDLVFMGMNLHHGTPEEILFLARQLRSVMSSQALFLNHDWFRPDDEPYQRRPDHNPADSEESYQLVDPSRLAMCPAPTLDRKDEYRGAGDPDWRIEYRELLRQRLSDSAAKAAGIQTTVDHVTSRDYPISLSEFEQLFRQENFRVRILRYTGDDPLKRFIAMPAASPDAALVRRLQQRPLVCA